MAAYEDKGMKVKHSHIKGEVLKLSSLDSLTRGGGAGSSKRRTRHVSLDVSADYIILGSSTGSFSVFSRHDDLELIKIGTVSQFLSIPSSHSRQELPISNMKICHASTSSSLILALTVGSELLVLDCGPWLLSPKAKIRLLHQFISRSINTSIGKAGGGGYFLSLVWGWEEIENNENDELLGIGVGQIHDDDSNNKELVAANYLSSSSSSSSLRTITLFSGDTSGFVYSTSPIPLSSFSQHNYQQTQATTVGVLRTASEVVKNLLPHPSSTTNLSPIQSKIIARCESPIIQLAVNQLSSDVAMHEVRVLAISTLRRCFVLDLDLIGDTTNSTESIQTTLPKHNDKKTEDLNTTSPHLQQVGTKARKRDGILGACFDPTSNGRQLLAARQGLRVWVADSFTGIVLSTLKLGIGNGPSTFSPFSTPITSLPIQSPSCMESLNLNTPKSNNPNPNSNISSTTPNHNPNSPGSLSLLYPFRHWVLSCCPLGLLSSLAATVSPPPTHTSPPLCLVDTDMVAVSEWWSHFVLGDIWSLAVFHDHCYVLHELPNESGSSKVSCISAVSPSSLLALQFRQFVSDFEISASKAETTDAKSQHASSSSSHSIGPWTSHVLTSLTRCIETAVSIATPPTRRVLRDEEFTSLLNNLGLAVQEVQRVYNTDGFDMELLRQFSSLFVQQQKEEEEGGVNTNNNNTYLKNSTDSNVRHHNEKEGSPMVLRSIHSSAFFPSPSLRVPSSNSTTMSPLPSSSSSLSLPSSLLSSIPSSSPQKPISSPGITKASNIRVIPTSSKDEDETSRMPVLPSYSSSVESKNHIMSDNINGVEKERKKKRGSKKKIKVIAIAPPKRKEKEGQDRSKENEIAADDSLLPHSPFPSRFPFVSSPLPPSSENESALMPPLSPFPFPSPSVVSTDSSLLTSLSRLQQTQQTTTQVPPKLKLFHSQKEEGGDGTSVLPTSDDNSTSGGVGIKKQPQRFFDFATRVDIPTTSSDSLSPFSSLSSLPPTSPLTLSTASLVGDLTISSPLSEHVDGISYPPSISSPLPPPIDAPTPLLHSPSMINFRKQSRILFKEINTLQLEHQHDVTTRRFSSSSNTSIQPSQEEIEMRGEKRDNIDIDERRKNMSISISSHHFSSYEYNSLEFAKLALVKIEQWINDYQSILLELSSYLMGVDYSYDHTTTTPCLSPPSSSSTPSNINTNKSIHLIDPSSSASPIPVIKMIFSLFVKCKGIITSNIFKNKLISPSFFASSSLRIDSTHFIMDEDVSHILEMYAPLVNLDAVVALCLEYRLPLSLHTLFHYWKNISPINLKNVLSIVSDIESNSFDNAFKKLLNINNRLFSTHFVSRLMTFSEISPIDTLRFCVKSYPLIPSWIVADSLAMLYSPSSSVKDTTKNLWPLHLSSSMLLADDLIHVDFSLSKESDERRKEETNNTNNIKEEEEKEEEKLSSKALKELDIAFLHYLSAIMMKDNDDIVEKKKYKYGRRGNNNNIHFCARHDTMLILTWFKLGLQLGTPDSNKLFFGSDYWILISEGEMIRYAYSNSHVLEWKFYNEVFSLILEPKCHDDIVDLTSSSLSENNFSFSNIDIISTELLSLCLKYGFWIGALRLFQEKLRCSNNRDIYHRRATFSDVLSLALQLQMSPEDKMITGLLSTLQSENDWRFFFAEIWQRLLGQAQKQRKEEEKKGKSEEEKIETNQQDTDTVVTHPLPTVLLSFETLASSSFSSHYTLPISSCYQSNNIEFQFEDSFLKSLLRYGAHSMLFTIGPRATINILQHLPSSLLAVLPTQLFCEILTAAREQKKLADFNREILLTIGEASWSRKVNNIPPQLAFLLRLEVSGQGEKVRALLSQNKKIGEKTMKQDEEKGKKTDQEEEEKPQLQDNTDDTDISSIPFPQNDVCTTPSPQREGVVSTVSSLLSSGLGWVSSNLFPRFYEDSGNDWGMSIDLTQICSVCQLPLQSDQYLRQEENDKGRISNQHKQPHSIITFPCGHSFHTDCVPEEACVTCFDNNIRSISS